MPRFTPKKKSVALLMGLALSVVAYGCFFFSLYSTWHRLEQIAHHGQPAVGIVVEKLPKNHLSARYEYSVAGVEFFGETPAGIGGVRLYDQINIGDHVPVTYLPERPGESVAGDSKDPYRTMSFLLFLVLPILCLFGGGVAALSLRMGTTFTWLDLITYLGKKKSPKITE
jgi:hypothetical protein